MMATNQQKIPITRTVPKLAQGKSIDQQQLQGKHLPCEVVTVNTDGTVVIKFDVESAPYTFPQVTVPVAQPIYNRIPIQVGDKGVARSADVYLGGVSNLGGGTANLTQRANLSTLVFDPISDAKWPAVHNKNQNDISGPQGVYLHDTSNNSTIDIGVNGITFSSHGHTIVINASGVTIDGKVFLTHQHTGVSTGPSNTGPVL